MLCRRPSSAAVMSFALVSRAFSKASAFSRNASAVSVVVARRASTCLWTWGTLPASDSNRRLAVSMFSVFFSTSSFKPSIRALDSSIADLSAWTRMSMSCVYAFRADAAEACWSHCPWASPTSRCTSRRLCSSGETRPSKRPTRSIRGCKMTTSCNWMKFCIPASLLRLCSWRASGTSASSPTWRFGSGDSTCGASRKFSEPKSSLPCGSIPGLLISTSESSPKPWVSDGIAQAGASS
mmetsp:Transcript_7468/g.21241  ORF Transcript_7468/g.21241 Transcript_7468/m.21241 type:complete len:238 (+) Transcript_7468:1017-1730(+)